MRAGSSAIFCSLAYLFLCMTNEVTSVKIIDCLTPVVWLFYGGKKLFLEKISYRNICSKVIPMCCGMQTLCWHFDPWKIQNKLKVVCECFSSEVMAYSQWDKVLCGLYQFPSGGQPKTWVSDKWQMKVFITPLQGVYIQGCRL